MANETIRNYSYTLETVKELYRKYELVLENNLFVAKERDTEKVIMDEDLKNRIMFAHAWVESNAIANNSNDIDLAFTKEATTKYNKILNSVEEQLLSTGNIDSIQVVEDSKYDPLALTMFNNKAYIEATNKWARMALPHAFPQTKACVTYDEAKKIHSIMKM